MYDTRRWALQSVTTLRRSLVAVIEEMRHALFEVEYHLAEHAVGPAKPSEASATNFKGAAGEGVA